MGITSATRRLAAARRANEELEKIVAFLTALGFQVDIAPLQEGGFLDGIRILPGSRLTYDPRTAPSPGDLLHEAGHLAILPEQFRSVAHDDVDESVAGAVDDWMSTTEFLVLGPDLIPRENAVSRALIQCGDQEAQAWSFTAALECGVNPASVFHRKAYGGKGRQVRCHAARKWAWRIKCCWLRD